MNNINRIAYADHINSAHTLYLHDLFVPLFRKSLGDGFLLTEVRPEKELILSSASSNCFHNKRNVS